MLPLKALQPSPLKSRRIDKKIAIDELAAPIQANETGAMDIANDQLASSVEQRAGALAPITGAFRSS